MFTMRILSKTATMSLRTGSIFELTVELWGVSWGAKRVEKGVFIFSMSEAERVKTSKFKCSFENITWVGKETSFSGTMNGNAAD